MIATGILRKNFRFVHKQEVVEAHEKEFIPHLNHAIWVVFVPSTTWTLILYSV